ncbi:MAG: hypothetical protein IPI35_09810 [Deltaproteobacteria bacterium]|nr:hypothetical protein [Deltaproteobacteria bacterium]
MGSRALLVLSLALFVACSGGSRDKAPEEAAKPSPSEQDAMMPPPAFPPLPGWLAFTVQERETRQNPWTPVHPNAKIVVFNPAGWDELNENTPFTALSAQGPLRVIYSELSYIPFGCDDNPTQMVAFQGGYDFAEEAIWLLPEGREGGKSLGVTAGAATEDRREWKAGDFTIIAERTGPKQGNLRIARQGQDVYNQPFEKQIIDGADDSPIDLSADYEVGLPVPIAAFTLAAGMPPVLVLKTSGYEGVGFSVFTTDGSRGVMVGEQSLYLCAF